MVNSALEQYQIADLIDWDINKRLVINRDFQRGQVWKNDARVYLIDTILRQLPIPKFYLRQLVNLETKQSVREIVDGQQRVSAILDFAHDRLVLTKRAGEFNGLRYSTLKPDLQESFLSYPIAAEHLINASLDDVLEVFARLNSYTVRLNAQELRHAKYQGEFKWSVRGAVQRWSALLERLNVVSRRDRVRMQDDELVAQLFGILIDGVKDGGQPYIERLYSRFDNSFPNSDQVNQRLDESLSFVSVTLDGVLQDVAIRNAPHFMLLFAAIAHQSHGVPEGDMSGEMPPRSSSALSDHGIMINNIRSLASLLELDESEALTLPNDLFSFWASSRRTTQRISSRKLRFPIYCKALLPTAIGQQ